MQIANVLLTAGLVYVGFVALMEGLIGFIQPQMDGGVRLTTTDAEGRTSERMLAGARVDGNLYIASNHWLRGWYHESLQHPEVEVTVDGEKTPRIAVRVVGEERDRLAEAYRMGFVLRFICGFAPSRFLRLDPSS